MVASLQLCYHPPLVRGRVSMSVRSKWESLPTEAINPSTLGIDKLSPADIVEGMLNEDRKMLAAVQREKGSHRRRHRDHHAGPAPRRPHCVRRRRHERPPGRRRVGRDAADLRHQSGPRAGRDGGRQGRDPAPEGRRRGQLRRRRALDQPAAPDQEGCRHRRVGERDDAVRARRPHAGARRAGSRSFS